MNQSHTPGPWVLNKSGRIRNDSELDFVRAMSKATVYGTVTSNATTRRIGDAERKANARLIAAAPELLEVLIALTDNAPSDVWGEYPPVTVPIQTNMLWQARDAIAKAKGE